MQFYGLFRQVISPESNRCPLNRPSSVHTKRSDRIDNRALPSSSKSVLKKMFEVSGYGLGWKIRDTNGLEWRHRSNAAAGRPSSYDVETDYQSNR